MKNLFFLFLVIHTDLFAQVICHCNNDQDGDGISGCFDKCPNTPSGASVDSHGCPMDTDGDGIADYLDKQLITPTECQPTDKDGIGICECPCKVKHITCDYCSSVGNVSIYFSSRDYKIAKEAKILLDALSQKLYLDPTCKILVEGFDNFKSSAYGQQLSWIHANEIIRYLTEVGKLDRERFILKYGSSKTLNLVEISHSDMWESSCCPPPPFPTLIKYEKNKFVQ